MQVNAQEIVAKLGTQPVVSVTNEYVSIDVEYIIQNAKHYEITLLYNILDENEETILAHDVQLVPDSDNEKGACEWFIKRIEIEKAIKSKNIENIKLFASVSILWKPGAKTTGEGTGNEWVFSEHIPFTYRKNVTSRRSMLTNSDVLDNRKKIKQQEEIIRELEHKKKNCYYCHGTRTVSGGNCNVCRGTGVIKAGYYTPQFFTCNYCGGTGRKEVACIECPRTDLAISFANKLLEGYQKTHGMTKEAAKLYYEHEAWKAQSDRDYQNAINGIVESYLDDSHNSSNGSGTSSSSDSKICPYCGGTGVSKIGILGSGGVNVAYTNASGEECPYCDDYDYEFHHHDRCTCKIR